MEKTGDINPKHTPDLDAEKVAKETIESDAVIPPRITTPDEISRLDAQDTPGRISRCCGGRCKPGRNAKS